MLISGSVSELKEDQMNYKTFFRLDLKSTKDIEELKEFFDWFSISDCRAFIDMKSSLLLFENLSDAVLFKLTWG